MHVGLNAVFLVPGAAGGMEIYARELSRALRATAPELRLTAFVGRCAAGVFREHGIDEHVMPVDARRREQWVLGEQVMLPRAAARAEVDLVHSLASTGPSRGPFARVTTVHDLLYLRVPETHGRLRAIGLRVLVPLAVQRSHRVIADSDCTRDDLETLLGVPRVKIDVVHLGVGRLPSVDPMPKTEVRRRHELGQRPLLLGLSAKLPHKNLAGLLRALALLEPARRPVTLLPGYATAYEHGLRALADQLGLCADVRWTGWLPDDELEGLWAVARAFVFPSLYEGFGLPVLEAMARGVPVVCSNRASLPEVVGDAALLVDPEQPEALAGALAQILEDDAARERLVSAGRVRVATFTWERTAGATRASYQRAYDAARDRSG